MPRTARASAFYHIATDTTIGAEIDILGMRLQKARADYSVNRATLIQSVKIMPMTFWMIFNVLKHTLHTSFHGDPPYVNMWNKPDTIVTKKNITSIERIAFHAIYAIMYAVAHCNIRRRAPDEKSIEGAFDPSTERQAVVRSGVRKNGSCISWSPLRPETYCLWYKNNGTGNFNVKSGNILLKKEF
ncbi:MAG: hypothetical protein BMS9Abin13_402 [Patescibacteria group bacterium]|nr:MAG: hypothetical protein BMS9Abin13_402 [Patescibacteria group bacterium]